MRVVRGRGRAVFADCGDETGDEFLVKLLSAQQQVACSNATVYARASRARMRTNTVQYDSLVASTHHNVATMR